MAGVAAVAVGVAGGMLLTDAGDPSVAPSPTPVVSPTSPQATPAPSPAPSPSPTAAPSPTASEPDPQAPSVTTAHIGSTEEAADGRPAVEVDVAYPQLAGLGDESVQEKVNTAITEAMEAEVDRFLETTTEPAEENAPPHSIWSRVTVGAVDPTVFSVLVPVSTYTGGAHPFTFIRTFTFDLADGEQVQLGDLFTEGILDRVSALAIDRLHEEYGAGIWAEEGAAPTEEELGRFVLTADHLQIWFDNYQVGPYAIGTPSVDIAYGELAEFVPAEGIVAGIAAD